LNNEVTREDLEKFCEGKSFKLSEYADKIIEKINKRGGFCPCRLQNIECPCPMHEDEIKNKGFCTCRLFEEIDKE
jgi:ferredoxin-thioredoxin reductase catalytic subunit